MQTCILTFICGLLYEITSTFWVFSTEQLKAFRAGVCSMIQAIVMLTGIAESIHDAGAAACFICGYSAGSIVGIWIERKNRHCGN